MYGNKSAYKYIEKLRNELHKLLLTNEANPVEVLKLSQELDKYIVDYYLDEKKCS
ncbi:MAG: aspartyl-phosphate phosphatase Spo0E family protein [Solirubrobacterales bacterium]